MCQNRISTDIRRDNSGGSSRIEVDVAAAATQQTESATVNAPLPTMGLFGSVALGESWGVGAELGIGFDYFVLKTMATRPMHRNSMTTILSLTGITALLLPALAFSTEIEDVYPEITSTYWAHVGVYFSSRDFKASAKGSAGEISRNIDFDSNAGLNDQPDLFTAEVGWQFSPKWGLALQYFESERSAGRILSTSVEWQDLVFDADVRIEATTSTQVTRLFFARQFRDKGPHSLRLGAGLHWLSVSAAIAGEATLDDLSREFRRSVVKADVPMPNIGAWYRYSTSRRWMFSARVDWLSGSVDKYKGGIWNAAVGINYSPWDHVGFGVNYQFFQLDGRINEDAWRGDIQTTFSGPVIFVGGHW